METALQYATMIYNDYSCKSFDDLCKYPEMLLKLIGLLIKEEKNTTFRWDWIGSNPSDNLPELLSLALINQSNKYYEDFYNEIKKGCCSFSANIIDELFEKIIDYCVPFEYDIFSENKNRENYNIYSIL